MRPLHCTLFAFAIAAPCSAQALPTILQSAISPSGQYTLAVTAPQGDPPPKGGGWVPLLYTLTDTHTGKTLWTRRQAATRDKGHPLAMPLETPPLQLFVADDATPLALTRDGEFANIEHPIGAGPRTPAIGDLFADDRAREARGMGWNRGLVNIWFINIPSPEGTDAGSHRACLAVRTSWGEHIIFDAHTCEHLAGGRPRVIETAHASTTPAEAARLLDYTIKQELVWSRATIAAAAITLPDVSDLPRKRDLELALQVAASLNLRDSIPDIRKIETAAAELANKPLSEAWLKLQQEQHDSIMTDIASLQSGKNLRARDLTKEISESGTRAAKYSVLRWGTLVPAVHQSLRMLGEAPHAGVGVQIFQRTPPHPAGSREALLAANLVPVDERLKALPTVKPGGQIWAAFESLGSPDGRGGAIQDGYYLYHFDTPDAFTLRITVRTDNPYVIESVEEIRPPLWREGGFNRTVITR